MQRRAHTTQEVDQRRLVALLVLAAPDTLHQALDEVDVEPAAEGRGDHEPLQHLPHEGIGVVQFGREPQCLHAEQGTDGGQRAKQPDQADVAADQVLQRLTLAAGVAGVVVAVQQDLFAAGGVAEQVAGLAVVG